MSRKLVITDGTRERELQLVGRLVVGRDPSCDISDDHSLLSRRHAEFVTAGHEVTVRDLGSRNGVFVNGHRAAERTLAPGDVVQIGPLRARYVVDDAPIGILPESVDDDRTAMLRTPAVAAASAAALPSVAAAAGSAAVLDDTMIPHGPVDDDVTRLVQAPARQIPAGRDDVPDLDDEITRFTPGPAAPELTAVLRPAPAAAPVASGSPALPVPTPAGEDLSAFVLLRVLLLALIAVGVTAAALSLVPGIVGVLLALSFSGGVAMMVAGIINGRVARAGNRG